MAEKNQPLHTVRIGRIKGVIWANDTELGSRFNTTFSRLYKDANDEWCESTSIGENDLLVLSKVADACHTFICDHKQDQAEQATA